MGKTSYKGLRVDYLPNQKVKVKLGRDWFDAEVVKSNKKTVVVRTLFSKTKYRQVQVKEILPEHGGIAEDAALGHPKTVLEPYTVSGTKVVKLPRIRVKPMEDERHEGMKEVHKENCGPGREELASRHLQQYESGEEPEMVEDAPPPEPEYEGPGLGKDEAPLVEETSEITMAAEQAEELLARQYGPGPTNVVDEPKAEVKPESAADVLAELEKMMH